MKYVLYAFLISICVMSSLANGWKYVFEGDLVAVENCEVPDSDESDSAPEYTLYTPGSAYGIAFFSPDLSLTNPSRYLSRSFSPIDLDYFSPPPNSGFALS